MPKTRSQRRIEKQNDKRVKCPYHEQKRCSRNFVFDKTSFRRVLSDVIQPYLGKYRFTTATINPIQQAAEHYLIELFETANALSISEDKSVVYARHFKYVLDEQNKREAYEANQRKLFDITKINKTPTELLMIIKSYLL